MTRPSRLDSDTDLAAADWAVRRAEGLSPEERAAFDRWLGEEPGAWRAYKESDRLWDELAGMDLRAIEARARPTRRRFLLPAGAAVAASLALALVAWQLLAGLPQQVYESARGEVRSIRLADGSNVTLGAGSEIAVRFDEDGRHIHLRRGEAMFDVRRDPSRPFDVRAADTSVTVLGTRFTVKAAPRAVRVNVIQGVVRVAKTETPLLAPFRPDLPERQITRGERLESPRGAPLTALPKADPADAAPWTQGRLVYENASLAEVVADLNRYAPTRIELAERSLGELRVTAALNQDQAGQFLTSLPATLPVRVERRGDEVLIRPAG